MDEDEDDGTRKILELFNTYRALHAKSYPSSSIDFEVLNLTSRVKQSQHATGKGHHSDVYSGVLDDHIVVGVKILRLPVYDPLQDKTYQSVLLRFFRELNHWSELDHVNIARLLGFTLSCGNVGFVSLWYQRGNLVQHVQRCPDASRPDLMLDVAEGVLYLHTLPESIIHGDLKGVNILVTETGIACLADFGISKQINDLNRQTGFSTTSGITGTTPWMAPELLQDAPLTHACDVYSYAGVLLEISCPGKYPYHYITPEIRVALAKSQGELPNRAYYQELDDHDTLWGLITTCLAISPEDRPDIRFVVQILYKDYSLFPRVDQTVACRPRTNSVPCSTGGQPSLRQSHISPTENIGETSNLTLAESTDMRPNILPPIPTLSPLSYDHDSTNLPAQWFESVHPHLPPAITSAFSHCATQQQTVLPLAEDVICAHQGVSSSQVVPSEVTEAICEILGVFPRTHPRLLSRSSRDKQLGEESRQAFSITSITADPVPTNQYLRDMTTMPHFPGEEPTRFNGKFNTLLGFHDATDLEYCVELLEDECHTIFSVAFSLLMIDVVSVFIFLWDTQSESNDICTDLASLCFSLAASFGAVVCKVWLDYGSERSMRSPSDQAEGERKLAARGEGDLKGFTAPLVAILLVPLIISFIRIVVSIWVLSHELVAMVGLLLVAYIIYLIIIGVVTTNLDSPHSTRPIPQLDCRVVKTFYILIDHITSLSAIYKTIPQVFQAAVENSTVFLSNLSRSL